MHAGALRRTQPGMLRRPAAPLPRQESYLSDMTGTVAGDAAAAGDSKVNFQSSCIHFRWL